MITTNVKKICCCYVDEISEGDFPPKLDCGVNTAEANRFSLRTPFRVLPEFQSQHFFVGSLLRLKLLFRNTSHFSLLTEGRFNGYCRFRRSCFRTSDTITP